MSKYECGNCGRSYVKLGNFKRHKNIKHSGHYWWVSATVTPFGRTTIELISI